MSDELRPVIWVTSSKYDLLEMPRKVIEEFGYGLYEAQIGVHPSIGKVMKGFGGFKVTELRLDDRDGTFRVVYTVSFKDVIIVLHAFQKKSKSGITTPKEEINKIHSRLILAKSIYAEWKERVKNG